MITESNEEDIKTAYGFDKLTIEKYFKGFGSKYVALLHTNEGKYIIKGMYNRDLEFFNFYKYLKKHKYPHLFTIRKTIEEHLLMELGGVMCYVYDYIEGETLSTAKGMFYRIGEAIAELHRIEVDRSLPMWSLDSILNDINNDRIPYVAPQHQSILKECLEYFTKLSALPKALIHGDIGGGNGIVNTVDSNILLIDWDGCGVAPRILEFGAPLFGLLSDDLEFNWTDAKELLQAYMTQIRFTEEEINLFIYAIIFLPSNYILIGDTEKKLERIKWFLQHENQIKALLK